MGNQSTLKRIALVIAGLAGTLIIIALIAPLFISVDTYKNQIITKVEAATGRTLTIDGKLSIKFFPVAGITAEKITLSNPAGFEDKNPFISLSSVTIDVAVIPLLHKEIVIKNFTLQDPVINLHVADNGIKNWVFASSTQADANTPAASNAPIPNNTSRSRKNQPAATAKTLPNNFMLNDFKLSNGTVLYTKGSSPATEVKNIDASVVLQSSATAAMIEGSAQWNGKTVNIKAGIGTLQSMLEEQKMEVNATIKSDLLNLTFNGNYDQGSFNGKETIKSTSVKELVAWLTPEKPLSTPAKLALQLDSDINCSTTSCNLAKLHLVLDALDGKGNIKVAWADPKPSIDLNFNTDQLDFNPFLSPQQRAGLSDGMLISDALAEASERWSSEPINLSSLNQINATANIQTGGIKFRKITIGKTQLSAKLQQGVLTANIPATNFYQGNATLSATVNAAETPATLNSSIMLKSVQVTPLLKDLANKDNVSGTADLQATLKSSATSVKAIISNLSGDGQIKILNGEIKHVALLNMLHNDPSSFGNPTSQDTVFTQIGGTFTITQGVISNRDLGMDMQGMNVSGNGTVNLPAYTLNYHLTPKLVTTAKDESGASTTKEGIAVPLIIEGSLDAPKFRPDLASTIQNALKDPKQFKQQLKNSKGVLNNLQGLFHGLQQGR